MSDEETIVINNETDTIHKPKGRGTKPACAKRLGTADFGEFRVAFRHAVVGSECGHLECFGGDDDTD